MRILRRLVHDVPGDLLAAAVAVVPATVLVVAAGPPWQTIAGGIIVLAPGYVLARILAAGAWTAEGAAVWVVALAIATVAVAGVMLDLLSPGLTERTWILALDMMTVVPALCWGRRAAKLDVHVLRPPRPGVGALGGGLCLVVAAALVVTALLLSLSGARAQERRQPFVQLWLLPMEHGKAEIGMRSGRSGRTAYRIVLRDTSGVLHTWHHVALSFGEQWQQVLPLPRSVKAGELLRAQVFAGRGTPALESIRVRRPG